MAFRVRADQRGGKRIVTLPGPEFVRRFLLHVLPNGIKRIRHYGLLPPGSKRTRLAKVREVLSMPAANPIAVESAQAFMQRVARQDIAQCPVCGHGRLRVVAVLMGLKYLPDPRAYVATRAPECCGRPAAGPPGVTL